VEANFNAVDNIVKCMPIALFVQTYIRFNYIFFTKKKETVQRSRIGDDL